MPEGESAKSPILPIVVAMDQFGFADFEPNVAKHRDNRAKDKLRELQQAALFNRYPSKLPQETDVGHRHLEQIERRISQNDRQHACQ